MSAYYLEHANISHVQQCFENFEDEALSLLALELPIPAYALVLLTVTNCISFMN